MTNKKGFALIAIPITIAILGLLGTGALASLDHGKNVAKARDQQRKADMAIVQEMLSSYYAANQHYPWQKDEAVSGWETLEDFLPNLSNDPLKVKGWTYRYWSDAKSYTLRYMLEETLEEQVIFEY